MKTQARYIDFLFTLLLVILSAYVLYHEVRINRLSRGIDSAIASIVTAQVEGDQ